MQLDDHPDPTPESGAMTSRHMPEALFKNFYALIDCRQNKLPSFFPSNPIVRPALVSKELRIFRTGNDGDFSKWLKPALHI